MTLNYRDSAPLKKHFHIYGSFFETNKDEEAFRDFTLTSFSNGIKCCDCDASCYSRAVQSSTF